jgi:hypothetical protein
MKVVKTRQGQRLHRMGFPVALKFENLESSREATDWLTEHYGAEPWMTSEKRYHTWCSLLGRWTRKTGAATFVGVKDERMITTLLLALS